MMNSNPERKKVLILSLSGIGNYLMQTPAIAALKKHFPDYEITLWLAPRGAEVLARNNPDIDRVIVLPIKTSALSHVKQVWQLRKERFDIGIMLSSGQLLKGAAYLFLAGIPVRIGHQYPFRGSPHSSFLLTQSAPEEPNVHDIEQNLNLLKLLDSSYTIQPTTYNLLIPDEAKAKARDIINQLNLTPERKLIGFHMGAAPHFPWKRWPLEYFIEVGKALIEQHNAHILLFGGEDEEALKMKVKNQLHEASIIETDLLTTAALMQRCKFILSNDSGLMHLAAASGVTVYALFGPTNEKETGPRGPKSFVLRAPGTEPVYITEKGFNFGQESHATLLALRPDFVLTQLRL
jgi:lipopolysaccharide heptosyltransferase II